MENVEELKEKLIKKLEEEMKKFKEEIREKGVDYAIDKAYELTSKQEIIDCLEFDFNLDKIQIKALISRDCLLDELYSDWLDTDGNLREEIGFSVDKSLDYITDSYIKGIKKDKKYDR